MTENTTNKKSTGRLPDFKGDGIAIWQNQKADGTPYLNVKLFGSISVPCWLVELNKQVPKNEDKQ